MLNILFAHLMLWFNSTHSQQLQYIFSELYNTPILVYNSPKPCFFLQKSITYIIQEKTIHYGDKYKTLKTLPVSTFTIINTIFSGVNVKSC